MKKGVILIIVVCLLIGAGSGYAAGYIRYEPKIRSYEIQVSNLTSEVSGLEKTITSQKTQISGLELEKSSLQTDLGKAQAETTSYKQQVAGLESRVSSLQGQLSTLESQASSLQERLDTILGITVNLNYQWGYGWQTWQWELPIPLSLYVNYLEKPRPTLGARYVDVAKDPEDDLYIDRMIQQINDAALESNFTEPQKLNFVIAFVQSLRYTSDEETTPYNEYPRYPLETLFDRGGDCEDTSILVAALLNSMGYDVALLLLQDAQHMAVGVSLSGTHGSYYEYDGKKYFYLETTGEGWEIGVIPASITKRSANIYPLGS
ncbi:hypothetical protein ACFLTG_01655 [Chloroflexota bacterium]